MRFVMIFVGSIIFSMVTPAYASGNADNGKALYQVCAGVMAQKVRETETLARLGWPASSNGMYRTS